MGEIFIVGSGVSVHLGMPGWRNILQTVARKFPWSTELAQIETLLADGQEYKAATCLANYLTGGEQELEEHITQFLRAEQQKIENQRLQFLLSPYLAAPTSPWIITTNWDTLLTRLTGFEPVVWPDEPQAEDEHLREVSKRLYECKKFVWHLHGAIGKSRLIVTESQRRVREESIRKQGGFLLALLAPHDLVILGSSFSDSVLVKLVEELVQIGRKRTSISVLSWEGNIVTEGLKKLLPDIQVTRFQELSDFYETFVEHMATKHKSYELIELDAKSADDLLYKLEGFSACQDLVFSIRETAVDLPKLTIIAAKAVIEGFRCGNTEVASILSMVLTRSADQWDADRRTIDELAGIVCRQLADRDPEKFHPIQPLAFAVGQKGAIEVAGNYLRCLLTDVQLRKGEQLKTSAYFGNPLNRYAGYQRHLKERAGLEVLGAWDLPSLMLDLQTAPLELISKSQKFIDKLLPMLAKFDPKLARALENEAKEAERRITKIRGMSRPCLRK